MWPWAEAELRKLEKPGQDITAFKRQIARQKTGKNIATVLRTSYKAATPKKHKLQKSETKYVTSKYVASLIFLILRFSFFQYVARIVETSGWCQNLRLVSTEILVPSSFLYYARKLPKQPFF